METSKIKQAIELLKAEDDGEAIVEIMGTNGISIEGNKAGLKELAIAMLYAADSDSYIEAQDLDITFRYTDVFIGVFARKDFSLTEEEIAVRQRNKDSKNNGCLVAFALAALIFCFGLYHLVKSLF